MPSVFGKFDDRAFHCSDSFIFCEIFVIARYLGESFVELEHHPSNHQEKKWELLVVRLAKRAAIGSNRLRSQSTEVLGYIGTCEPLSCNTCGGPLGGSFPKEQNGSTRGMPGCARQGVRWKKKTCTVRKRRKKILREKFGVC